MANEQSSKKQTEEAALLDQAKALHQQQKFEEAVQTYEQAVSKGEPPSAQDFAYWTEAVRRLPDAGQHLPPLETAIHQSSKADHITVNDLGTVYFGLQEYPKALQLFEKATQQSPTFAIGYSNQGLCHQRLQQLPQAVTAFRQCLALEPLQGEALKFYREVVQQLEDEAEQSREVDFLKSHYFKHLSQPAELNTFGIFVLGINQLEHAASIFQKCVELDDAFHYGWYNWGLTLYHQERYTEAIEKFRQTLQLVPDYDKAYTQWVATIKKMGAVPPEIEELQHLIDTHLPTANSYNDLGTAFYAHQEYDKAIECYEKSIGKQADFIYPHFNKGLALDDLGQPEAAKQAFQRALDIDANYLPALHHMGNHYAQKGALEKALDYYQRALQSDPKDSKVLTSWREVIVKLENPQPEITRYQEHIQQAQANSPEALNDLGNLYFDLDMYAEAIKQYEQAIALDDSFKYAYFNLGLTHAKMGLPKEAIDYYNQALEIDATYSSALEQIAYEYQLKGDFAKAIEFYRRSFEHHPDQTNSLRSWRILLESQRQPLSMDEAFKAAVMAHPSPEAWHELGLLHAFRENFERAEQLYQEVLQSKPDFVEVYFSWGNALLDQLNYEAAKQKFAHTLDLPHNLFTAYSFHNVAHIDQKLGQFKQAKEQWHKALGLYEKTKEEAQKTKNSYHFLYHGNIYHHIFQDYAQAEKLYEKGYALDKQNSALCVAIVMMYQEWKKNVFGNSREDIELRSALHVKTLKYYRAARTNLEKQLGQGNLLYERLLLSELYLNMEDLPEAEESLMLYLKTDPNHVGALKLLSNIYIRKEGYSQAVATYQKALKHDPDDLDLRNGLAEAYLKNQNLQKARSEYKKIQAISPYHLDSLIGMAEVHVAMGDMANDRNSTTEAYELFSQANQMLMQALEWNNDKDRIPKTLNLEQLSSLYYSIGYTKVRIYETQTIRQSKHLQTARKMFAKVDQNSNNYFKAQRSLSRLKESTGAINSTGKWGPRLIVPLSLLFFVLIQFAYFVGKPRVSRSAFTVNLQALQQGDFSSSELETVREAVKGKTFFSEQQASNAITQAVEGIGKKLPNAAEVVLGTGELLITGFEPIDATAYGLLSFGALIFIIAGLFLKEITRLKFGAIELEKSSFDFASSSTGLGINR